jgi:hypothetical protein
MNCQEFWNAMPQVTDAAALANHEHLAHCPACSARLRSQLALKKGLRAVAGQMSRIEAPAPVEARLRTAFRAHAGREAGASRSIRVGTRWMPVLTWAAAAALLAVAVVLNGGRQPASSQPAVSRGSEMAVAAMPAEIETDGGTPVVASGFIALPNAAQIGPNEEVNLVRVEVPRSTMIAMGYDVKPEEASDSVKADVMLGNDGLARAVRFLD